MRSISARACDHHGCCTCQVPCCSFGRYQDKSTVVRKLKDQDGNLTGEEELQVSESELAPNLQAMSVWLYHHDDEWRKVERRQDEDADIPKDIDHGISIDSWIKDKLK